MHFGELPKGVTHEKQALFDNADATLGIERRADKLTPDQMREQERARLQALGIRDVQIVIPTNDGAHRALQARIDDLIAEGYEPSAALKIALDEMPSQPENAPPEPTRGDSYLGASVESLMAHPIDHKGGSRKGRTREQPPIKMPKDGSQYDPIMADIYETRSSEADRARRALELQAARIDGAPRPGPARKGRETRIPVTSRVEPSAVLAINDSGHTCADVLALVAACIQGAITWPDVQARLSQRQDQAS